MAEKERIGKARAKTLAVSGYIYESATDGIVAHAGGGQAAAVPLTTLLNRVVTVATAADSVGLPVSVAGLQITVTNAAAANSMTVYGVVGDVINALAANSGFAVAANKTVIFTCYGAGQWHSVLTA